MEMPFFFFFLFFFCTCCPARAARGGPEGQRQDAHPASSADSLGPHTARLGCSARTAGTQGSL